MPELSVALFDRVGHLWPNSREAWVTFHKRVADTEEGSHYSYSLLQERLR
jgi:hypothetical protein